MTLNEKTYGCLLGVAIGDAMGLPLECKSPTEIREKFGYVDTYISNKTHHFAEVSKEPIGTISDDTQLTLAMMDALKGKYSIDRIKQSHIEASNGKWGTPVGWGKTTRTAIANLKEGKNPSHVVNGAGNGTCMKIAPLAIFFAYKAQGKFSDKHNMLLMKKCHEINNLTHGDQRCSVAAYCQARMIIRAMQDEIPYDSRQISDMIIKDSIDAEGMLAWEIDESLVMLSDRLIEFHTDRYSDKSTSFVSRQICTSQSSFILNSYPLVAYCLAKYLPYRNFKYAITETINAGADADSNGSMVGAVAGALWGISVIPTNFVTPIRKWQMITAQIKEFEQKLKEK